VSRTTLSHDLAEILSPPNLFTGVVDTDKFVTMPEQIFINVLNSMCDLIVDKNLLILLDRLLCGERPDKTEPKE
jgi:hypothetical protein